MNPRELPIVFTAESVRAILENRKSQTRRVISGERWARNLGHIGGAGSDTPRDWGFWSEYDYGRWAVLEQGLDDHFPNGYVSLPPRYRVGDVLWAKETWRTEELGDMDDVEEDSEMQPGTDGIRFRADGAFRPIENTEAASEAWCNAHRRGNAWRSPLYMPRWASRLTLEVTEVRAQRVQDISEEDAKAEGMRPHDAAIVFGEGRIVREMALTHRGAFACAWDRINGKRSPWSHNDFVFAYTFRRIEK